MRNLANLANRQFLNLCLNVRPLLIWVIACARPPNDTGSAPRSPEDAPVHCPPQTFTSSWQMTYANFRLWLQLWQQSSIWEIYQKIPQPTLWPRSFLFVKRKSSNRTEMLEMMYSLKMLKTRTFCAIKAGRKTCVEESGWIWIQSENWSHDRVKSRQG